MLWPLLALMVRWVPWIFSTVPRILTGGLGAWATATADTAAISNAANGILVRIMGSPRRWTTQRKRGKREAYSIYTAGERKLQYAGAATPKSFIERRSRDWSCPYPGARSIG